MTRVIKVKLMTGYPSPLHLERMLPFPSIHQTHPPNRPLPRVRSVLPRTLVMGFVGFQTPHPYPNPWVGTNLYVDYVGVSKNLSLSSRSFKHICSPLFLRQS
jgi:hypothetical protein